MNEVFGDYIDKFLLVYLDDLLVYSDSEEQHEEHLRLILQRLREHKLKAKLKKCEFGKQKVKYLGHIVGSGELSVDHDKVVAVTEWEPPTDVKGVQQFMGFANYYHLFVRGFTKLAEPISRLLGSKQEFKWGTEQ